jgi:hypothetical protein
MEEVKLTPYNNKGYTRDNLYDEWDDYEADQIPYDDDEDYDMWDEEEEEEEFWDNN